MTMRIPNSRCGFHLFQECIALSRRGVYYFKLGLNDFHPPATIQELGEGCGELVKMEFLRTFRWLDGDIVEFHIREGIHETYE